ncbi:MAG: protein translocase subunit SecD [Chthoniobacterales bacterium]
MSPAFTFSIGLLLLVLFGWYFATDYGLRKRLLATTLMVLLVVFSLSTIYPPQKRIQLGLDLKGGTSFLIRLVGGEKVVDKVMLDQAVEVIRKRVDFYGGGEPLISPVGDDRILVQMPGLSTEKIQDVRAQLSRVARLEFRLVYPDNGQKLAAIDAGTDVIPPEYRIESYNLHAEPGQKAEEERLLVKKRPDLGGEHVTTSHAYFGNSGWGVNLNFDPEGAKTFGTITEKFKGYRFAIVLDGLIQSAPVIRDAIYGGSAEITGRFGEQEARNLASVLENPLETPVRIEEQRSVSPTLGADSIRTSVMAGLIGLALTLAFMMIYYRLAGFIANLALLVNVILLLGALTMFNFVLTLPGIAGIILTVGIAIDANVLIYERLREELALGKSLKVAIAAAYEKAFSSIFDANVTTLITAVILFWKATGPVKGFAISLTLGVLASMFTALIVSRNGFSWLVDNERVKKLSMMHVISSQNFNFLSKGLLGVIFSALLITAGMIAFGVRGEKNFGVDFRGGDLLTLSTAKPVDLKSVREALRPLKMDDAPIQQSRQGDLNFVIVRGPFDSSEKIEQQIIKSLPDAGFKVEQSERVGALVGSELARNAAIALGLGIIGILFYVAFRFELSFAVGAVVALLHDCLMTIGIFALLGKELSLTMVAAILTILGYSINDTIVVFDRVREGLASGQKGSIQEIMNASLNQTLSRTILTSGVTLIPLLCLYFLGGSVLHDFSLAIIIGIVFGTYSSIFIASPIVLWWLRARGGSTSSLRREVTQKTAPARPTAAR